MAEGGQGGEGGGAGARFELPYHNVTKLSDLPSPVAGVRTLLPGITQIRGTIQLPAGESIKSPDDAVLRGWNSSVDGILGNVDGPLIHGEKGLVVTDLFTQNVNTGSDAYDYELTGTTMRTSRIEDCSLRGHRCIRVGNHVGLVSIRNSLATGPAPGSGPIEGIVMEGQFTALQAVGWSTGNTSPGHTAIELKSTAVLGLAILIRDCNFIHTQDSDRAIKLSSSATVPPMASIAVLDCAHVGGGALFDESAGHWGPSDIEIMARGSATGRDSTGSADFGFSSTSGVVTTIANVDEWTKIVTAGGGLTSETERFTVVEDDPTHGTYAECLGPHPDQPVKATLHVSVERASGSGNNKYEVGAQKWTAADAVPAWVDIPRSQFMVEVSRAADPIPTVAKTRMSKGDRIRHVMRNRTDTDNVRVLSYQSSVNWE